MNVVADDFTIEAKSTFRDRRKPEIAHATINSHNERSLAELAGPPTDAEYNNTIFKRYCDFTFRTHAPERLKFVRISDQIQAVM